MEGRAGSPACHAIGKVLLCVAAAIVSPETLGDEALTEQRHEWQYQSKAGLRRIAHVEGVKWTLHFPNGATNELQELSRTDQFIELRNLKNSNVLRIYDGYAESHGPGKTTFRKFADGRWVEVSGLSQGKNDYRIRVVYFVPADRTPLPAFEHRIRNVLTLAAEIITLDLRKKGYDTKGPQFRLDSDGQMAVQLVRGDRNARSYSHLPVERSPEHPRAIFAEVDRKLGDADENLTFIFAETYEDGPSTRFWPGHVAVAAARPPAGGIGVFSAWILRDEFYAPEHSSYRLLFFDETPIPGRKAIGYLSMNSPKSEFMEDGVGGALHELAHTFGLTHHGRGQGGPRHFMGQGFRNLRWNVGLRQNPRLSGTFSKENGWMLMTSRYLNSEVDRDDNTPPQLRTSIKADRNSLNLEVVATDDRQLSLLTIVEVTKDDGRQLIYSRKLSGKEDTVRFRVLPSHVSSNRPKLQFILIDAGGNHRKQIEEIPGE